jgi:hypothetical protein
MCCLLGNCKRLVAILSWALSDHMKQGRGMNPLLRYIHPVKELGLDPTLINLIGSLPSSHLPSPSRLLRRLWIDGPSLHLYYHIPKTRHGRVECTRRGTRFHMNPSHHLGGFVSNQPTLSVKTEERDVSTSRERTFLPRHTDHLYPQNISLLQRCPLFWNEAPPLYHASCLDLRNILTL